MRASQRGDEEVVKLLLGHGADPNMQDSVSVTDMIYMSDDYVVCVYVCVYGCVIDFMFVCPFVCLIDCMYTFIIVIIIINIST